MMPAAKHLNDNVSPAGHAAGNCWQLLPAVGAYPPLASVDKRAPCNCKKSRCLKLYCDCFAAGDYCNACNCQECFNSPASEEARQEAVTVTLKRNPNAFRQKIKQAQVQAAVTGAQEGAAGRGVKHAVGCHCKKSKCLKKYCECYQAGISCGDNCKCEECRNFAGSTYLRNFAGQQQVLAAQPRKRSKTSLGSGVPATAVVTVTWKGGKFSGDGWSCGEDDVTARELGHSDDVAALQPGRTDRTAGTEIDLTMCVGSKSPGHKKTVAGGSLAGGCSVGGMGMGMGGGGGDVGGGGAGDYSSAAWATFRRFQLNPGDHAAEL
jgi:hypothetical protein